MASDSINSPAGTTMLTAGNFNDKITGNDWAKYLHTSTATTRPQGHDDSTDMEFSLRIVSKLNIRVIKILESSWYKETSGKSKVRRERLMATSPD